MKAEDTLQREVSCMDLCLDYQTSRMLILYVPTTGCFHFWHHVL